MGKLRRIRAEPECAGWSRWIRPDAHNYIMRCCDCGLSHRLQFKVGIVTRGNVNSYYSMRLLPLTKYRPMFRVQRANAYTRQARKR